MRANGGLSARIREKDHALSTLDPLAVAIPWMTLEAITSDVMIASPDTRPMGPADCDGAVAARTSSSRPPESTPAGRGACGAVAPGGRCRQAVGTTATERADAGPRPTTLRARTLHW